MDPDPVCPERLDPAPNPVNIRPDPQPWDTEEQMTGEKTNRYCKI